MLGILSLLALTRFILVGVIGHGLFRPMGEAWFGEELPPLTGLLVRGIPLSAINVRQYGVVAFLVLHPAMVFFHGDLAAIDVYALVLACAAVSLAFALVVRRYFRTDLRVAQLWGAFWFSFLPLLLVLNQRQVDAWDLAFISSALFLFTGTKRMQLFSGIPLAFGALTKLLPGFLLLYLCVRQWRAGAVGLLMAGMLLGVGQALYGPLLGFKYPFAILAAARTASVSAWSVHDENNSVRGLIYKVGAGFGIDEDPRTGAVTYRLQAASVQTLNILAYGASAALMMYVLLISWMQRRRQEPNLLSIEFSLAIVAMLLASPMTAPEFTVVTLPVFAVLIHHWMKGVPSRWSAPTAIGTGLSAILLGIFVPVSVFLRLLPMDFLLRLVRFNAYQAIGRQIGAYVFLGFPGLGLLILFAVLISVHWKLARDLGNLRPSAT